MKTVLKLEYLGLFGLAIFGLRQTGFSWWWLLTLFFAPDISMLGYVVNPKVGAFLYNLFHHFGVAVLLWILGFYFKIPLLGMLGCVVLAHSVFDRMLGYGLKYEDSFQNTHLGKIGKEK